MVAGHWLGQGDERIKPNLQFLFSSVFATEAILIRKTRLTDTSLIVHWFTEEEGLVKTVVKGALRPKSIFAGKLDLFFSGEISVLRARRGELHILRELVISNWRQGLRRNYESTLMAGYFCQLVEAGVGLEHADAPMHDLLSRALDHLDCKEPTLRAMFHFEKGLAEVLGIAENKKSAEATLGGHLGQLPASRKQLVERLGPPM